MGIAWASKQAIRHRKSADEDSLAVLCCVVSAFGQTTKMTIVKWIYNGFKSTTASQLKSQNEAPPLKTNSDSVHNTPPGVWPSEGPRPSKLPVVLFYISVIATILGSIISIRSLFITNVSKDVSVIE